MSTLVQKHWMTIVAGLVCLGAIASYAMAHRMLRGMYEELHVAQYELSELEENERVYDELAALATTIAPERDELLGYFLSAENPTPLLTLLEELAQSAGMEIVVESLAKEVEAATEDSTATTSSVAVVLSASGPWSGVHHLIQLFEHLPYVLVLDRIAFEEEVEEQQLVWKGQIHMRVFTQ